MVISVGTYINYKSVTAGRGPSAVGIALQVAPFATMSLLFSLVLLLAIYTSGLWPASILLIPILGFAAVLVLGAVQGWRRRRP
jgi:hypothetical protein